MRRLAACSSRWVGMALGRVSDLALHAGKFTVFDLLAVSARLVRGHAEQPCCSRRPARYGSRCHHVDQRAVLAPVVGTAAATDMAADGAVGRAGCCPDIANPNRLLEQAAL